MKCFAVSNGTTRVRMLSFGIDTGPQSFIVLPIIRCSKSAQKSAVQVCQVTAVMETTRLVQSQFKNFYCSQCKIEQGLCVPKIISECREFMSYKL